MRLRRKYAYIIYKPNDAHNAVEIEKLGEKNATLEALQADTPKDRARWIIYDLSFVDNEGLKKTRLCFLLYAPDNNCDAAERFVVAANKDCLKSKISEVNCVI